MMWESRFSHMIKVTDKMLRSMGPNFKHTVPVRLYLNVISKLIKNAN